MAYIQAPFLDEQETGWFWVGAPFLEHPIWSRVLENHSRLMLYKEFFFCFFCFTLTGRGRGHSESIFLAPRSLWPASDRGEPFLKDPVVFGSSWPWERGWQADGGWWAGRFLGNLLTKDGLGSELTTVNPVSTLFLPPASRSCFPGRGPSFWALGSRWREDSCGWDSVAELSGWAEPPGFSTVSLNRLTLATHPGSARPGSPPWTSCPDSFWLTLGPTVVDRDQPGAWGRVSASRCHSKGRLTIPHTKSWIQLRPTGQRRVNVFH